MGVAEGEPVHAVGASGQDVAAVGLGLCVLPESLDEQPSRGGTLSGVSLASEPGFAFFTDQIARYSNMPVFFSTPTIIIMPISRKMTFQSTPESSE
jgi:hypothetical protein